MDPTPPFILRALGYTTFPLRYFYCMLSQLAMCSPRKSCCASPVSVNSFSRREPWQNRNAIPPGRSASASKSSWMPMDPGSRPWGANLSTFGVWRPKTHAPATCLC
jgi:hypothetical protein